MHFRQIYWVALWCCTQLLVSVALAQDPVFSQYTTSATHSNPGMLGLFDGEVRLAANFRDQWTSALGGKPLRTMAASGELRYNVRGKDYIGVGLTALQDEGGQASFRQNRLGLGVSLQKYLGGGRGRDATVVGFGGRVGYGQNSLMADGLWYTSDIDTSSLVIEPGVGGLPPGYTGQTLGFLDVSAGVNLAIVRREYSLTAGLAAHHLNRPNNSFLYDGSQVLPTRYTGLVALEVMMRDELRFLPSLNYERQGKSNRIMGGGGLAYMPQGEGDAGFRVGTYGRMANKLTKGMYLEAIVLVAQVEFKRTVVGISYDVNTGSVGRAVDGRGAYEVSLAWTRPGRSRYKVVCPKL